MPEAIAPKINGLEPVAPPPSSLMEDYAAAGSAKDMYSLMPRAAGTTLAPKILRSAEIMSKGSEPVAQVLSAADSKGGIQTSEGRIAAADTFKKYQPETGFLKGIALGMMGVKDWQKAATQGVIVPVQEFDRNGRGAISYYAQNSDVPVRVVDKATGQDLTMQDYESRNFGKYKSITDTPGYLTDKKRTEAYTESAIRESAAANVLSSVERIKADNANQILSGFSELRRFGLTDAEINQLYSKTSKQEAVNFAVSAAEQEFSQANDSKSLNDAIEKLNKVAVDVGLPKITKVEGNNSFTDSNGNSWSRADLLQKMKNVNSRSGQERQWTQNREQIVQEAVYKKLEGLGAKSLFDNIMNLQKANMMLTAEHKDKYADAPVFAQALPYELGQPMKVGMSNAVIQQANAEIAEAYRNFYDQQVRDGVTPAPGSVAAAFRRSGIPANISAKYAEQIDKIQSMPDVERESGSVAKEAQESKPKGVNTRSILSGEQKERLSQTSPVTKEMENKKPKDHVAGFREWQKNRGQK